MEADKVIVNEIIEKAIELVRSKNKNKETELINRAKYLIENKDKMEVENKNDI